MTFPPRPCSEFPNDNPELHDGAVWVCHWSRARPRAVISAPGMARMLSGDPGAVTTRATLDAEAPEETSTFIVETSTPTLDVVTVNPQIEDAEPLTPTPTLEVVSLKDLEPKWQAFALELQAFEQELEAATLASATAKHDTAPTPGDPVAGEFASSSDPRQLELNFAVTAPAQGHDAAPQQLVLAKQLAERETPAESAATADPEIAEPLLGFSTLVPTMTERAPAELALALLALDDVFDATDFSPTPAPVTPTPQSGVSGQFRVPRPEAILPLAAELEPETALNLEATPLPPGTVGWDELVGFLAKFLLAQGATRAAALLPALLEGRRVDLARLPDAAKASLSAAGIAEAGADGCYPTAEFRHQATAFHLDFTAGRAAPQLLFDWIASVVRALLASAAAPTSIRVYLEQAGIDQYLKTAA